MVFKRTLLSILILPLLWVTTHAAPVELHDTPYDTSSTKIAVRTVPAAGQPGSQSNPIITTFDVSTWQDIAEQDCYAILCDYQAVLTW
jgi:hypothetical protein